MLRKFLLVAGGAIASAAPIQAQSVVAAGAEGDAILVVTHGFSLAGAPADWMFEFADDLRDRLGDGQVLVFDPATGQLVPCSHSACDDAPADTGPLLVVMDWAAQSNDLGSGFSEAAAEALFADLVEWSQPQAVPRADLSRLHLVGHSRGAVVNSEVAERLIAAGYPPPLQLTTLDPHDTGGARRAYATPEALERYADQRGGLDDLDVNQEHPEYADRGVLSWSSLGYHDNYWRTGCLPGFLDPDGMLLPGAMNFDMTSVGDAQGNDVCHSDVHAWYRLTVSGAAAPAGWFSPGASSCSESLRSLPLDQSVDGFNGSDLGGLLPPCPDDPMLQQDVLFDFGLLEGLVNSAFERNGDGSAHAGWSYNGGGGDGTIAGGELILTAGEFREHSRFWVPLGAAGLRLCYQVEVPGGTGSELALSLCAAGSVLGGCTTRQALSVPIDIKSGLRCGRAPFTAAERGRGARLRLELPPDPRGAGSADVRVTSVRFVLPSFFDGFESGDLSAWAVAAP